MRPLSFLIVLLVTHSLPAAEPSGWGHFKGQIVVDKMIERPPLIEAGAPIFAIQNLKQAQQGIPPQQIGVHLAKVPDLSILVDKKTKGLKNVFVYLRKAPASIHPALEETPETPAEFRRPSSYECAPYALFIRTKQVLKITNDAQNPCSVHTFPIRGNAFNRVIPAGETFPILMSEKSEPFPVQVKDDLHPTAKACWLVLDHPYAAVSAVDGSFEIKNLPAGKHEFAVWHNTIGFIDKKLTVEIHPNETTTLPPIQVTAKKLLGEEKAK